MKVYWKNSYIFLTTVLLGVSVTQANLTTTQDGISYKTFPQRQDSEAAVVEWENSAIISAIDAAVASFGPQTNLGAFFEVETTPVLGIPLNGRGTKSNWEEEEPSSSSSTSSSSSLGVPYPGPLDNSDEVHGNMVILTNEQSNMSPVALARVAKESNAAALMIVNVNPEHPDTIYSMQPQTEAEALYAQEHIDIPVIMVSLASGNLITTAASPSNHNNDDDQQQQQEEEEPTFALPERVRLYAAGDRPYFEDVISQHPVLYLIHHLLDSNECQSIMQMVLQGKNKLDLIDDTISNLLENTVASADRTAKAHHIHKTMLWKGTLGGHFFKQLDERIEQVTGYPQDQLSDWMIFQYEHDRSSYDLHLDVHPIHPPVATISVFLNDDFEGGDMVYPQANGGKTPIKVTPKRGLAVVHHNTDYDGEFDSHSIHGELSSQGHGYKYVAKRFVYSEPLSTSMRVMLPMLAILNRGKLPRWIITVYDYMLVKFGLKQGHAYFEKACRVIPIIILGFIVQYISNLINGDKTKDTNASKKNKKD